MSIELSIDMFFNEVNTVLDKVVIEYGIKLLSVISPIIYLISFSAIMMMLLRQMIVYRQVDINELGESIWRILIFCGIFFSANNLYYRDFIQIASTLGDELSSAIIGHSGATGALNKLIDIFLTVSNKVSEDIQSVGILDALDTIVMSIIIAITGIIAFIPLVVAACVGFLGIKFVTTILLIVAPLFCAAGLFNTTRQYFLNWFGLVCNTITLTLMLNIVFGIEMRIIEKLIDSKGVINDLFSWIMTCIILCTFTYFLRLLPEISSSLTSGSMGMARSTFGINKGMTKGNEIYKQHQKNRADKLLSAGNNLLSRPNIKA